jgi:hypothetical protein
MNADVADIMATVARTDPLHLREDHGMDYRKVARMVDLDRKDLSQMTAVKLDRVRFDGQIPKAVRIRLEEIANIISLVAEYFEGDAEKTVLWFRTKNPGLGDTSPREMLRMNRHNNLRNFILAAREEHGWG